MLSKAHNATDASSEHVNALRHFNRFYTQRIGVLAPYLGSELSLTEVRVLYELAHRPQAVPAWTASGLAQALGLDMGYLSRILKRFESRRWLERTPSVQDRRQGWIVLTAAGHRALTPLQQKSNEEAAALLATVAPDQREPLVQAMQTIERSLMPVVPAPEPAALLREPRPGDMGWVVQQHGEIYAHEYGWNAEFEGMVARLVSDYVRRNDAEYEHCWIAELQGRRVGSVFVVRKSRQVAQLRMLILTPEARGLGLGGRLTDACIAFARAKGYRRMVLWTNSCLDAARAIYARRDFVLTRSEPYMGFGKELVGETWERKL